MHTVIARTNISRERLQDWATDNNMHSLVIEEAGQDLIYFSEPDDYNWLDRFLVRAFTDRFGYIGGEIEVL